MDAIYPKPPQILPHNKSAAPVPSSSPAPAKAQLPGTVEICQFHRIGKCRYGSACKKLHVNPPLTPLPTRTSLRSSRGWRYENGLSDYDGVGGPDSAREGPQRNYLQQVDLLRQLPRREDILAGHVAVNKHDQRLDAYMPPPDPDAESRLRARSASGRLCNAKQLRGSCGTPGCEYDHGHLDEDLKPALEWLARSLPCAKRSNCRNAACLSGHVCLKPDCKHYGTGKAYCKIGFPLHLIELAVDRYVPATVGWHASNGELDYTFSVSASITEDEDDDEGNTRLGGTSI